MNVLLLPITACSAVGLGIKKRVSYLFTENATTNGRIYLKIYREIGNSNLTSTKNVRKRPGDALAV